MASTSRAPAAQTVLPDEIWEEIFLRLDAAADLVRTSAACSSFRRVVSERRFLRRFRSLRSPAVLGFISKERHEFVPVDPPHRSAPEARALKQAADFTFSFLPDPTPSAWRFRHARDGRVLLDRHITKSQFKDLVVCDPLHRRYVRIPPIPTDLMASTPRTGTRHLLPVLSPAGQNDEEESFRVICTVLFEDKAMAFVFSSCNQTWRGIISTVYLPDNGDIFTEDEPYYAHGCLYWLFFRNGYSLMLNTSEMEFSIIDLPPHDFDSMRAIVEAEEGRLRFLTIAHGTTDLYCKNWQINGVGAQELQHDKLIPLPEESGITYRWEIDGTAGHYLALLAYRRICDGSWPNSEYFVLDIKTLRVEKLYTSNNDFFYGFPYASFPPLLALPSI